ncbi:MAG: hypothetical protein GC159_11840 [Phycisphaera sp.]|nr:hypothetical protein [Phycisphaera sp.]
MRTILAVLSTLLIVSASLAGPKPSDTDVALWLRGIYSDDSAERITSTVEITKHAEHMAGALPHLKACLAREEEVGIKNLMLDAIHKIEEATGQRAPAEPSDVKAIAAKVEALVGQLDKGSDAERRQAATGLRLMGVLASPALPALSNVAEHNGDALTAKTAATAVKSIRAELWFDTGDAPTQINDRAAIEAELTRVITQLVAALDDKTASKRLRAIKSLSSTDAAGAPALARLHQVALNDENPGARRLAGLAIRRITAARDETEAYYKQASKKSGQ